MGLSQPENIEKRRKEEMKSRMYPVLVWLALVALLLGGCGQAATPTATAVPTLAAKATVSQAPAATAVRRRTRRRAPA